MSCQSFTELSEIQKNQLATNLAALILHDSGKDVNCENVGKVLNNSGLKVPDYWANLLGKALEGKSVGDYLSVSGGSGGQGVAPVQAQENAQA